MKNPGNKSRVFVFRRWTNKWYAVLTSFHKIIKIGALAISSCILNHQPLLGQVDTTTPQMFYHLEEVESFGETDSEIFSEQLRQLVLIQIQQTEVSSSHSIPDLLDKQPGIDIRTRGVFGIQSDLHIMGGSFDQTMVMLNGLNISDPQTGHFNMDVPVFPELLDKIEVLKGSAAKDFGLNAYSGAVNLVTQPADSLAIQTHASTGSYRTYRTGTSINIPAGNFKNLIAGSIEGSAGYIDNTDFNTSQFYFHSNWEKNTLQSDFFTGWNEKKFGANAFYTPRFPEQYEETSSFLSGLKFEYRKPRIKLTYNAYWRRHQDHFMLFRSNPSAYENYHETDVIGTSLGGQYSSKAGITAIRFHYRYEQIFSTSLGEETDKERKIPPVNINYPLFDFRNHITLSVRHQLQVNRFTASGGLLLHPGIKGLNNPGIFPGLDLGYDLNENYRLFASVNRSMRLPTFTDLYYEGPQNKGNPNLLPELALTWETGIKYKRKHFHSYLSAFYREGRQTIDWIWNDSLWQTMNLTVLNTYGVDFGMVTYPSGWISFPINFLEKVSIGYSHITIEKGDLNVISNYALDNLKNKVVSEIGLKLPFSFYINWTGNWQDRNGSFLYYDTPTSDPYERPYTPVFLMDVNIGYTWNAFSFFVDISNLFDIPYRDLGSVMMPGRWMMIGISWN